MNISVNASSPVLNALQTLKLNSTGGSAQNGAVLLSPADSGGPAEPSVVVSAGLAGQTNPLQAQTDALDQAASLADAGTAAGLSVGDLLQRITQVAAAASPSPPEGSRAALHAELSDLLKQIGAALKQADVDGQNMVDGSKSAGNSSAGNSNSGSPRLTPENMSLGGPVVSLSPDASVTTADAAATTASQAQASITSVQAAVARIKSQADQIATRYDTVYGHSAASATGAKMGPEPTDDGVRLLALQVQQSLSAQGGSITSAGSHSILSLFKL